MRAMGAELVYVTGDGNETLATAAHDELAAKLANGVDNTVFTAQHNNPSNADGYHAVAHELTAALGREIDCLIGAVGTGGSLCGTGWELRRTLPDLRVIGVEPVGSIAFGGPGDEYFQSGTGTPPGAKIGVCVDFDLIDEGCKVSDVDAFATARIVARRTGLLIGGSAGGVVHDALARIDTLPPGSTVVTLICDGWEKYLNTVFYDDWMRSRKLLDPTANSRSTRC